MCMIFFVLLDSNCLIIFCHICIIFVIYMYDILFAIVAKAQDDN